MDDIEVFLAVAEEGSQTAAARRLGRSLQAVNRALAALERRLGVELIRRTTRRSFTTDAGRDFYRKVKPAIAAIAEAQAEAAGRRTEPRGLLRLGSPVAFGAAFMAPAIAEFVERHPGVEVDLRVSDSPVDVIAEALDLAVRVRHLPDSSLRARKLGELRIVAYGAPEYFRRRGHPARPDDLAQHACIVRSRPGEPADAWTFSVGGEVRAVDVAGPLRTNEIGAVHAAARQAIGVGYGPWWQIRPWLDDGALETVLEPFEPPRLPVSAVFPASRGLPAKTRLFLDLLAARLAAAPL